MKTFYITTPIYYVNDKPHIGHAYTTIACDIINRFHKLKGEDVYFLTGTDEHGQKCEKASIKASIETKKFVTDMSKNFSDLVTFLNCEINDFIRTTEKRHIKAAQSLWNKLLSNDQIYLDNYEGWYSVRDEAFYSKDDLIEKNNKFFTESGEEVEWVKEESYFFKLSKWENKLLDYYSINKDAIAPKTRYNEVISFIKSGLKDLSISRTTFKWGVPVPNNKDHVMYVWIDALCNYLTSIGYPDENSNTFKKYWPGTHVVGKDILRFHAVYWPAFLMAANLEPPKRIFSHGWWTNNSQKISKSLGNSIDPYEVINKFGLDQIRYFLFSEVPFGNDGDFSEKSLIKRINADLSNNFGNLIQRVCSFINKNCNSIVKNNFDSEIIEDFNLLNASLIKFKNYKNYLDNQQIDKAIKEIIELITEANVYCDKLAPWKLIKIDKNRMNQVLSVLVEIIRRSTILLFPIIPDSSKKIFHILNIESEKINFEKFDFLLNKEHTINKTKPIFPRIDNTNNE